jgi:biopolymer transport protein ExbB/TolQ
MNFSLLEAILGASLIVKGVLLLLIIMLIIVIAIILQIRKYTRDVNDHDNDYRKIFELAQSSDLQHLESIYQHSIKYRKSSLAYLYAEVYSSLIKFNEQLMQQNKGDLFENAGLVGEEYIARSLQKASAQFLTEFDRYRPYLAAMANISPFVGLFGTVLGIINAFGALASGAGGGIEVVAPGIAEALFTTAVGIGVSIPASWFFNYFTIQLQQKKSQMNNFSLEVENMFQRTFAIHSKK